MIARRIRFADLRFTSAVPTTGTGQTPLSPDAVVTEIRRSPLRDPQLVQGRPRPHQPGQLQGQPRRHSRGVAATLRGLTPSGFGQPDSGSPSSDSTSSRSFAVRSSCRLLPPLASARKSEIRSRSTDLAMNNGGRWVAIQCSGIEQLVPGKVFAVGLKNEAQDQGCDDTNSNDGDDGDGEVQPR